MPPALPTHLKNNLSDIDQSIDVAIDTVKIFFSQLAIEYGSRYKISSPYVEKIIIDNISEEYRNLPGELIQVYKKLDRNQLSRFYLMEFKKQSDYEKTRGDLLDQLQMRPKDLDLIRKLARLYEQNGRRDRAMDVWYKALYFGDSTAAAEMERIKGTTSRP